MSRGTTGHSRVRIVLLTLVVLVLMAWALRALQVVVLPLVTSVFIVMLIEPVQQRLDLTFRGAWRWVGVLISMVIICAVFALFAAGMWLIIDLAVGRLPDYVDAIDEYWNTFADWAQRHNLPFRRDVLNSSEARSHLVSWVTLGMTSIWSFIIFLGLVFFMVLLMLIELRAMRKATLQTLEASTARSVRSAIANIAVKVRTYLLVRTGVSLLSGGATALWLWLVGVDLWFLWAGLTFLLNYVPNIGSIISVIPPTLIALVQFGPGRAAIAIAGLAAIEQIIGNFLDPRLQGRVLSVSPLLVLLSILFWGWMWGIVGALLAVPLTVTILVICAHVEALRPIAELFSRGEIEKLLNHETE